MAQLKIDLIVEDHGGEAKLRNVEAALKGVEATAAGAGLTTYAQSMNSAALAAVSAGSAYKELETRLRTPTWTNFKNEIVNIAAAFGNFTSLLGGIAIGALVNDFVKFTSKITDLSARTGVGVRELQRLQMAGDLVGVSLETTTRAITQMQNRLGGGDRSAIAALNTLGLSLDNIRLMDPGAQFETIARAIAQIPDPLTRTALAMDLFGRSGAQVLPIMRRDTLDLVDAMGRLGFVMSEDLVAAGDAVGDAWTIIGFGARALVGQALRPLLEHMMKLTSEFERIRRIGAGDILGGMFGTTGRMAGIARIIPSDVPGLPGRPSMFGAPALTGTQLSMSDALALSDELTASVKEQWRSYGRLREVAPRVMHEIAQATLPALQATVGLANVLSKLPGQINWDPFKALNRHAAPELGGTFATGLDNIAGILPGAQPLPTVPDASRLQAIFGTARDFGTELSNTIMGALMGGGDMLKSLGAMLGGKLFGPGGLGGMVQQMFGKTGIGGLIGSALGSFLPGIGNILGSLIGKIGSLFDRNKGRDLVEDFAASMGGFEGLSKTLESLPDGKKLWENLTQGVGRNNPEQARAAIEAVTRAIEEHKQALQDAMSAMPQAVVARAENITTQHDFSTVGAEALGTMQFLVSQGQSAIAAFQAIAPAVTAMQTAMQGNNFEMTAATQRLFELNDLLTQHKVQWDNIAASGTIMDAMLKANIMDASLFAAVAGDIGMQMQTLINNGVAAQQVFALAQPQLQAIWEAQQRWHFAVDETTQALIDQAVQQGFVGEHAKSVNQQILDVLLAIGKVLGADLPAYFDALPGHAQNAANGVSNAFTNLNPVVKVGIDAPSFSTIEEWMEFLENQPHRDMQPLEGPEAHSGGLIGWRRMHVGGLAHDEVPIIGQRGEFMMSRRGVAANGLAVLNRMNQGQSVGGGVTVNVTVEGSVIEETDLGSKIGTAVAEAIRLNKNGLYTRMSAAMGNA